MSSSHAAFEIEIGAARAAFASREHDVAFARLERAHILGQLRFADHVVAHVWMLRFALELGDGRELRGQILRIAATVPGHMFGWLPIGNTGGANVSPLKPMPIPADLASHFQGFSLGRQMLRQGLILSLLAALASLWIAIAA